MTYVTTLQLARFLNLENKVPNIAIVGSDRVKESVGTGDNSTTRFFLDYGMVLDDSYTLYYGSSESTATSTLTEGSTEDYTLSLEDGEITLTSTGVATLTANGLFAEYSHLHNGDNIILTDSDLSNALERAEDEVNERTGTIFVDGTLATPGYVQVNNEEQDGQGEYHTTYYLSNYPLPTVNTTLDGAVSSGDTTITVSSTNGFPESGTIGINTDKITYTGKTSTTFTGCSGVSNDHDDGETVYPYVIEISTTVPGSEPSWTVLERNVDYDLDEENGRVHLYRDYSETNIYDLQQPQYLVPNRFRATYIHGYDTIPEDIKRLTLMLAAKEIENMRLRKMNLMGIEFSTTVERIDDSWIKETILAYKSHSSSNI